MSQKIAMPSGRAIQPWEVLEMNLLSPGVKSLANNGYMSLIASKFSIIPSAFPSPSKQVDGVARQRVQLCLTLETPEAMGGKGGQEVTVDVTKAMCRRLRANI